MHPFCVEIITNTGVQVEIDHNTWYNYYVYL